MNQAPTDNIKLIVDDDYFERGCSQKTCVENTKTQCCYSDFCNKNKSNRLNTNIYFYLFLFVLNKKA